MLSDEKCKKIASKVRSLLHTYSKEEKIAVAILWAVETQRETVEMQKEELKRIEDIKNSQAELKDLIEENTRNADIIKDMLKSLKKRQ